MYWFHPLVWIAWRQLALEAERSCDDAVLGRSEATAYADQLVGLRGGCLGPTAAKSPLLAMANRADLATRVGAVLDGRQRRGRAGRLAVSIACAAAATLVVGMSPLQVAAAPQASTDATPISARFRSDTGLVMLDVAVADAGGNPVEGLTAKDFAVTEDGSPESVSFFEYRTAKDEHNLMSSYYILGYYTHNRGQDGQYRKIKIASKAENIGKLDYRSGYYAAKTWVPAASPNPAPAADPSITPPALISKVEPAYSDQARKAKFQGTVMLQVAIDETGKVTGLKVVRSLGLGLDEKAVEAVQSGSSSRRGRTAARLPLRRKWK